jgi:hypothetical protein
LSAANDLRREIARTAARPTIVIVGAVEQIKRFRLLRERQASGRERVPSR